MSKINDYLAQRKAASAAFWKKALAGAGPPVPRDEMLRRVREAAAARPPAEPLPSRDLDAEQAELRDLLALLPWLKPRAAAETISIPLETLKSYLSPPESARFRPLRSEQDADTLWALLRDTAHYIQISLPEAFQQPVPPLPG